MNFDEGILFSKFIEDKKAGLEKQNDAELSTPNFDYEEPNAELITLNFDYEEPNTELEQNFVSKEPDDLARLELINIPLEESMLKYYID
jgi:hypothetical protein